MANKIIALTLLFLLLFCPSVMAADLHSLHKIQDQLEIVGKKVGV